MPMITVNLATVREEVISRLPAKGDVRKALIALSAAARAEWIAQASDHLKSTSRDYIQGIGEPVVAEKSATIQLTGTLPNMVENGWPETDLRKTVLTSPHARTAKDGSKYLAVPFRHGTPGTGGRNVGNPMPKPIHNVARHLTSTQTAAALREMAGRKQWGGRLGLDSPHMNRKARDILSKKEKEWHSTSIYSGMIRKVASYGKTAKGAPVMQSSYQTFRTISSRVRNAPEHWLHPGIEARNFAGEVQKFVRSIAGQVFRDAVGGGRRRR